MGYEYKKLVWDIPLDHGPKILILAIADHVNDKRADGIAWPSQTRLCHMAGIARSTLNKYLKVLKAMGLIEITPHTSIGKGKKANVYRLNITDEHLNCTKRELMGKFSSLAKELEVKRELSSRLIRTKVQSSCSNSTRDEPESLEPLNEPLLYTPDECDCDQELIPTDIDEKNGSAKELNQKAWNDYEAYRKRNSLPELSGQSLEQEKNRLAEYGGYAEQIDIVMRVENFRLKYIPPKGSNGV